MKSLSQYIIENQQVQLSEFVVNEGLLSWLKKMWNWIFNDAKDNVSKNNGVYKSSPELLKAVSDNKKIDGKFIFGQLDDEAFNKFLKDAKSENKGGTFNRAKELKTSESTIYSCILEYKKEKGTVAILICEADKKSKELKIKHIVLANDIVKSTKDIRKHPLCSQIVKEFDKYIKNEIKFIIKGDVKSEIVDNEVVEQPNDDKSSNDKGSNDKSSNDKSEENKKQELNIKFTGPMHDSKQFVEFAINKIPKEYIGKKSIITNTNKIDFEILPLDNSHENKLIPFLEKNFKSYTHWGNEIEKENKQGISPYRWCILTIENKFVAAIFLDPISKKESKEINFRTADIHFNEDYIKNNNLSKEDLNNISIKYFDFLKSIDMKTKD